MTSASLKAHRLDIVSNKERQPQNIVEKVNQVLLTIEV